MGSGWVLQEYSNRNRVIDKAMLDEEFGLAARGLRSCFVVTLGHLDKEADYNASLPKSRLSLDVIAEEI